MKHDEPNDGSRCALEAEHDEGGRERGLHTGGGHRRGVARRPALPRSGPPRLGRQSAALAPLEQAIVVLVRDLVAAGMDCMRINCAHDDVAVWARMIEHLARANHECQRACRVSMDVAGPKLRTAPIEPGPAVLKIKPRRDAFGTVTVPAVLALVAAGHQHAIGPSVDAVVTLDADPPPDVAPGQLLECTDVRGKRRRLRVRARSGGVVVAELERTAYIVAGTCVRFGIGVTRRVVNGPPLAKDLLLKKGDTLLLTPPGRIVWTSRLATRRSETLLMQ